MLGKAERRSLTLISHCRRKGFMESGQQVAHDKIMLRIGAG